MTTEEASLIIQQSKIMLKSENKNGPIVLVSPSMTYIFPSGYAYLAGYLVERGEKVKILIRPKDQADFPKLVKQIMDLKPLLAGFGGLYPDLSPIKKIIPIFEKALWLDKKMSLSQISQCN